MRLPSCHPVFESQAHHLWFYQFKFELRRFEKTKINRKRGRDWPIFFKKTTTLKLKLSRFQSCKRMTRLAQMCSWLKFFFQNQIVAEIQIFLTIQVCPTVNSRKCLFWSVISKASIWAFILKICPSFGLFFIYFCPSHSNINYNFRNTNWNKWRLCAWDSNLWPIL